MARKLNRQVAVVTSGFISTGIAVLLSQDGYFMVHQSALPFSRTVTASLGGRSLTLHQVTEDKETGLTLLQARPWDPSWGDPARTSSRPAAKGDQVYVFTIEGPRRSTVSDDMKVGQVRPSLRYVPLSEIRLEEKRADITGAVAFTPQGELVGVLSGTVGSASQNQLRSSGFTGAGFGGTGGGAGPGGGAGGIGGPKDARPNYGPGELEVGFAYGSVLLERVVQGFLSPDRKVRHPWIGVFFRQSSQAGAALEVVMPGSPAADAGLAPNDIIIEAGGKKVGGPIELAVILFDQRVGDILRLKARRGQALIEFDVKVGAQGLP